MSVTSHRPKKVRQKDVTINDQQAIDLAQLILDMYKLKKQL
jgi:hypothetical protein